MRLLTRWFLNGHRISLSTNLLLLSVWCLGCGGPAPLTVERYRSRGVVLGVHGPIIGSGEPLAERMSLLVDSERNLWVEEFLVLEEEAVL